MQNLRTSYRDLINVVPQEGRSSKILIIEDSALDISILTELLCEIASIQYAETGKEALSFFPENDFDLILVDIMLPDMTGFEVLEKFAKISSLQETPIIIISALSDPLSEEKGLNLGAVDFISKPFHPASVRVRVKNQIALSRATTELRKANEKLSLLAAIDPLTDVFNRRQFEILIRQNLEDNQAQEMECCYLMLDFDHFKNINDQYGHEIGDKVLRSVAKSWNESLRPGDILGRLGGEEFEVFLPHSSFEQGQMVADRLRQTASNTTIFAKDKQVEISASIGLIYAKNTHLSLAKMRKAADDLLYKAKHAGRNCVQSCELT